MVSFMRFWGFHSVARWVATRARSPRCRIPSSITRFSCSMPVLITSCTSCAAIRSVSSARAWGARCLCTRSFAAVPRYVPGSTPLVLSRRADKAMVDDSSAGLRVNGSGRLCSAVFDLEVSRIRKGSLVSHSSWRSLMSSGLIPLSSRSSTKASAVSSLAACGLPSAASTNFSISIVHRTTHAPALW